MYESLRADRIDFEIERHLENLDLFARLEMPVKWAQTQFNLGYLYADRLHGDRGENLNLALSAYRNALQVFTIEDMAIDWANTQANIAITLRDLPVGNLADNLQQAIDGFRNALQVYTSEFSPAAWARVQVELATTLLRQVAGNRSESQEQAIALLKSTLDVRTKADMPLEWAQVQMYLGNAYRERIGGDEAENMEEAIAYYKAALEIRRRDVAPDAWAMAQMNLGNAFAQRILGSREHNQTQAIACFEAALQVQTRSRMPLEWARTSMNLGLTLVERRSGDRAKNLDQAIALFDSTLEVYTRQDFPVQWARTQVNRAIAYRQSHHGDRTANVEQAIAGYRAALKVFTREAFPIEWAEAQGNLGNAYQDRLLGDPEMNVRLAEGHYAATFEILKPEVTPRHIWGFQRTSGEMYLSHQRWSDAARALAQSTGTGNRLLQLAVTHQAKRGVLKELQGTSSHLALALIHLGDFKGAVLAIENGLAKEMSYALRLNEASLASALPADAELFQSLRDQIHHLQSQARISGVTPGDAEFLKFSEAIKEAYAKLDRVIENIQQYSPKFFRPVSYSEIVAAAMDCPLLYLFATDQGGYALQIDGCKDSNQAIAISLPSLTESALRGKLNSYLDIYERYRHGDGSRLDRERWLSAMDEIFAWLWDVAGNLLVEALKSYEKVTLICEGIIGLVPLHSSWTHDELRPTRRRYALDHLQFRYAPNGQMLSIAQRSGGPSGSDSLLAIDEPLPVSANRLPNSSVEVASVVSYFAEHERLTHEHATRREVLKRLTAFSHWHFSCHAYAERDEPLKSSLVMAADEVITLHDLLDLQLPTVKMAVLSACETGAPGTDVPTEVLSLPSGLMQAGVNTVIASLWSVADVSTMMLMTRFYKLWRHDEREPCDSLREAQMWVRDTTTEEKRHYLTLLFEQDSIKSVHAAGIRKLIEALSRFDPDGRDFAHPFHWGAFCYTGV
jgi:tetratricopeptide (TPR) repeat protein